MRFLPFSRRYNSYLEVALIILMLASNTPSARPLLPDQQTKLWNEIITLYNQGYDIIEKQHKNWNDKALWDQREITFTKAANKLNQYISTYIQDPASLTYLRAKFRLGTYWEIAQNFKAARESYLACNNHPLIKDASATFDGKALEPQVKERLAQVETNMRKQYSRRPGYIYIHRGGGQAIFEEEDIEFLPSMVKDMCP